MNRVSHGFLPSPASGDSRADRDRVLAGLTRNTDRRAGFPVDPAAPFRVDPASDRGATPMAGPLIDTTLDMRTNAPDRQELSR
jgi:hypothetical protein